MQIYKITTVLEITTTAKCIINLRGLWAFRFKKNAKKITKVMDTSQTMFLFFNAWR